MTSVINTKQFIIARPQFSLDAAAKVARQAGIEVIMMSDCLRARPETSPAPCKYGKDYRWAKIIFVGW